MKNFSKSVFEVRFRVSMTTFLLLTAISFGAFVHFGFDSGSQSTFAWLRS